MIDVKNLVLLEYKKMVLLMVLVKGIVMADVKKHGIISKTHDIGIVEDKKIWCYHGVSREKAWHCHDRCQKHGLFLVLFCW